MQNLTIHMEYHDDWMVNILLLDGRVFSFFTECWIEHGLSHSNWPAVIKRARRLALELASRDSKTWSLESLPETIEQFHAGMDSLCRLTNDNDFRLYTRSYL